MPMRRYTPNWHASDRLRPVQLPTPRAEVEPIPLSADLVDIKQANEYLKAKLNISLSYASFNQYRVNGFFVEGYHYVKLRQCGRIRFYLPNCLKAFRGM